MGGPVNVDCPQGADLGAGMDVSGEDAGATYEEPDASQIGEDPDEVGAAAEEGGGGHVVSAAV